MALSAPAYGVLIAEWVLVAIATALIVARLHLRLVVLEQKPMLGDFFIIAAWACAVALSSLDIKRSMMGLLDPGVATNLQGYKGTPEEMVLAAKTFFFGNIPFFSCLYLCKAALLSVYFPLFPKGMKKRRLALWITTVYVAVTYVVCLLSFVLYCTPSTRFWTLDRSQACPDSAISEVFAATWALHFVGDLLIFGLPWLVIPGLQMKPRVKLATCSIFMLGAIHIVFSIVRFAAIESTQSGDAYPNSLFFLWCTLDTHIGLIVACLPALGPYIRKWMEYGSTTRSQGPTKPPQEMTSSRFPQSQRAVADEVSLRNSERPLSPPYGEARWDEEGGYHDRDLDSAEAQTPRQQSAS